jgi:hypothetical protein
LLTGARFRYGRRYLQREDRLAIDPVQLPLTDPDVAREYVTEEGFALFNGIRDAALMVGAVISWIGPLTHRLSLNSTTLSQQENLVLDR